MEHVLITDAGVAANIAILVILVATVAKCVLLFIDVVIAGVFILSISVVIVANCAHLRAGAMQPALIVTQLITSPSAVTVDDRVIAMRPRSGPSAGASGTRKSREANPCRRCYHVEASCGGHAGHDAVNTDMPRAPSEMASYKEGSKLKPHTQKRGPQAI